MPEQVVGKPDDGVVDRVPDELDRDQYREDHPEVAANELEAALEAAEHAALLDLHDRSGEAEVDEDDHGADEEADQADDHGGREQQVDGDQFHVGDVAREVEEAGRLLVLRMGQGRGDRAAEEHLAEKAGGGDRGPGDDEAGELQT